jgi:hypothetical protein
MSGWPPFLIPVVAERRVGYEHKYESLEEG